jgi:tetratricopeptide (TPR) repeat protein
MNDPKKGAGAAEEEIDVASAATLTSTDVKGVDAPTATAPAPPDYEILGELGRGGMGVVYKARAIRLNRLVALKMILAGPHAGLQDLARFRREAESAACLQHPNIVQIYEVGDNDGRPFLSLEYVGGGSLADRLDGTPAPPEQSAELVEALARAMHYAHSRGIVHRDLKPANILLQLDEGGRMMDEKDPDLPSSSSFIRNPSSGLPKITDFGLAKKIGDASGPTQSGSILGTPSYMSPEQASGKTEQIGPATDIYALGAILYELLTGRPPFKAATPLDTVLQVVGEEPVAPRRLQPRLPRDLETICVKCLQKDPRRRYGDAGALADDLHRFLAGEPVRARPIGWAESFAKWARRRPAVAALLAISLVATAALVILGLLYETRLEQSNTELTAALADVTQAKENEEQEHARGQAHLSKALEVIDQMLTHVWDEPLGNSPPILALRRRLLQEAREYYEWNLQLNDEDPAVRRETARACFRTAGLHLWIGETAQSELFSRKAIELQSKLAEDFPDHPEFRHDLSQSHAYLGHSLSMSQKFEPALAAYTKSISLAEKLVGEHPSEPAYRETLARNLDHLALLQTYVNPAQSEVNALKVIKLGDELVHEHPDVADYQCLLANAYANLVMNRDRLDRGGEMKDFVRKGLQLLEPPGKEPPQTGRDYARGLALLTFYDGVTKLRDRHWKQAEPSLKAGISGLEELVKRAPIFPYRFQLAMSYPRLAQLYEETNNSVLAEENYRKTLETTEQLFRDYPSATFLKQLVIDRQILLMVFSARKGEGLSRLLTDAETLARQAGLNDGNYYNLACLFAQASALPGVAAEITEERAHRAMQFLERVAAKGFLSTNYGRSLAKTDRDLNPLRKRKDFQELLRALDEKTKGRTGGESPP